MKRVFNTVMIFLAAVICASCIGLNNAEPTVAPTPEVKSFVVDDNDCMVLEFTVTVGKASTRIAECGFYFSKNKNMTDAERIQCRLTGSVFSAEVDVKDYDIKSLRSSVAMVLQKNLLFAGTIKDNIRWGNKDATDEEIIEACKLASAHDFIESFPEKYDTHIEQGGTNVSGGQKQRLCIARALISKPKILILDDSTSAVDMKTDAMIRAGLKKYLPETTKIIIAQRIASVQDADLIIVMDNGKISAKGNHKELLETSEIYREVYEQQNKGGDENE